MAAPPLVALDWGTSSLRGARLAADGGPIDERRFERGILSVAAGEFRSVFDSLFGDWMAAPGACCLIAGMAGSQQGWVEVPYCACPAGLADIAGALRWVEAGRIAIVPGLSGHTHGVPAVMRGEETQVFGALRLLGVAHGLFVLPGTHSKWVRVEGGRIVQFQTVMTGEFYALLRRHSILARTLPAPSAGHDDVLDGAAFDAGVAQALRSPGLMQSAFSARTLALFDLLPLAQRPSYLSGLVIGEELRSQPLDGGSDAVTVIGDERLTARYERALRAVSDVAVRRIGTAATWHGLVAVAAQSLAAHSALRHDRTAPPPSNDSAAKV